VLTDAPRTPRLGILVGKPPAIDHIRPGGNLTGISVLAAELNPKRLELLSELVPQAGVIALLVNSNSPNAERVTRDVQEAARTKGVQLDILKAGTEGEIDAAFATLVQHHTGALLIAGVPFSRREQLAALAERHSVPVIYDAREFAEASGLISYGASRPAAWHQAGIYPGSPLTSKPAAPSKTPRPWRRTKARARPSSTTGRATKSRSMRWSVLQSEIGGHDHQAGTNERPIFVA